MQRRHLLRRGRPRRRQLPLQRLHLRLAPGPLRLQRRRGGRRRLPRRLQLLPQVGRLRRVGLECLQVGGLCGGRGRDRMSVHGRAVARTACVCQCAHQVSWVLCGATGHVRLVATHGIRGPGLPPLLTYTYNMVCTVGPCHLVAMCLHALPCAFMRWHTHPPAAPSAAAVWPGTVPPRRPGGK